MCLLVAQPASSKFDDNFIRGVYRLNSDGIGVMYAENNSLFINRCVPNNEEDFVKFFKEHIEGRDCAWHARMKTHGDIDLANCHPYQVLSAEDGYPLYLAHNGVLATGNAKDKSKSDTWHYIQDYLRPMLLKNPEFFMTDAFSEIIGDHIGSGNKFILMDAYGNSVTINERVGVTHQGAWLSNTYAWDTEGTEHDDFYGSVYGYNSKFATGGGRNSGSRFPAIQAGAWEFDEDLGHYAYKKYEDEKEEGETAEAAETQLDDKYDEMIDFVGEFFAVMAEMGMCSDGITWQNGADYFTHAGSEQAWGIIECVQYGAYTLAELIDEMTYYSTPETVAVS